jgi:hypothetical protein
MRSHPHEGHSHAQLLPEAQSRARRSDRLSDAIDLAFCLGLIAVEAVAIIFGVMWLGGFPSIR